MRASAAGFPPGDHVTVRFDSIPVASASASAAGQVSVALTFPAAAVPGSHLIRAADAASRAAAAGFTVFTAWSSFRFGAAGTGANPLENVLDPVRVPGLTRVRSLPAGGPVRTTSVLVAELDLSTGNVVWTTRLGGGGVASSVTSADGVAYVKVLPSALAGGSLVALAAASGTVLKALPLPGPPPSPALIQDSSVSVANGTVITGTWASAVRVFFDLNEWPKFRADNLNDGYGSEEWTIGPTNVAQLHVLWTADNVGYYFFSAAVTDGVVYAGSEDGKLYAFPASCSGACSPLWTGTSAGIGASSPAVANGVVYLGVDGQLAAFSR